MRNQEHPILPLPWNCMTSADQISDQAVTLNRSEDSCGGHATTKRCQLHRPIVTGPKPVRQRLMRPTHQLFGS